MEVLWTMLLPGDGVVRAVRADLHAIEQSFGALRGSEIELPARSPDGRAAHLAAMWEPPNGPRNAEHPTLPHVPGPGRAVPVAVITREVS
jgi:hypothetical protein